VLVIDPLAVTFAMSVPSAYQIGNDEPVPLAVQRITTLLLDETRDDLRPATAAHYDEGIHGARKKLKRARAMLRLIRDEIGASAYKNENVVLRDTGRTIAGVRDAKVLGETLIALLQPFDDTHTVTREFLTKRYLAVRSQTDREVLVAALDNLGAARSRFAAFPIEEVVRDDFAAIAPGLRRTYARGRRSYRRSTATHDVHALHRWRKRVKYLRHQMEALVPIEPEYIGRLIAPLDELGQALGTDHDLAVLSALIVNEPTACATHDDRLTLIGLAAERRAEFVAILERLGATVYADSPDEFISRIGAFWAETRH
jgi:CHAD domain-containing protein